MYIIEPCCAERQVAALRRSIDGGHAASIGGYEDMSLAELLPAVLTRYSETGMLIAAPSLPDQAADAVAAWMKRQWARADGNGYMNVIGHLTLIADLDAGVSPKASRWLRDNPFEGRLTLVDLRQEDTVVLLPDFAVTGPVNLRYGRRFTATATTIPSQVADLWRTFQGLAAGKAEGDGNEDGVGDGADAPEQAPVLEPVTADAAMEPADAADAAGEAPRRQTRRRRR
jgi:hypothetical protein